MNLIQFIHAMTLVEEYIRRVLTEYIVQNLPDGC